MREHGTESMYSAGCRCDSCREASNKARKLRRQGKGPGFEHLKRHGWRRYRAGCRCDTCRAANARVHRAWYARNRAKGVA